MEMKKSTTDGDLIKASVFTWSLLYLPLLIHTVRREYLKIPFFLPSALFFSHSWFLTTLVKAFWSKLGFVLEKADRRFDFGCLWALAQAGDGKWGLCVGPRFSQLACWPPSCRVEKRSLSNMSAEPCRKKDFPNVSLGVLDACNWAFFFLF